MLKKVLTPLIAVLTLLIGVFTPVKAVCTILKCVYIAQQIVLTQDKREAQDLPSQTFRQAKQAEGQDLKTARRLTNKVRKSRRSEK